MDGVEVDRSAAVSPWSDGYYDLPLRKPADGVTPAGEAYTYSANDMSVGDVDGDGQYEFIVKWDPSNSKDVSQVGYTGNVYIDTYRFDGTLLHRIDLGVNIRAGAHYTQFLVYDFDGDGRAEMMFKTAPGTKIIRYDKNGEVASEKYITMPREDVRAGYGHGDDYRLSARGTPPTWRMSSRLARAPRGGGRELARHHRGGAGAEDELDFAYPLSRPDAEELVDYFIDEYAPSRSGNNRLRNFEGSSSTVRSI